MQRGLCWVRVKKINKQALSVLIEDVNSFVMYVSLCAPDGITHSASIKGNTSGVCAIPRESLPSIR